MLREPPSWELSQQIFDKLVPLSHLTGLCSNSPVQDFIVECPANLVPKLIDLEQQYLLLHMRPSLVYPQGRERDKTHIVSYLVIDCLLIKVCISSHFSLFAFPILFIFVKPLLQNNNLCELIGNNFTEHNSCVSVFYLGFFLVKSVKSRRVYLFYNQFGFRLVLFDLLSMICSPRAT